MEQLQKFSEERHVRWGNSCVAWDNIFKKAIDYAWNCSRIPVAMQPLASDLIYVLVCLKERRKTKREEKELVILPALYDMGGQEQFQTKTTVDLL